MKGLSYTLLGDPKAPYFGFVTHGVLGAGHNLRSFMKRIVDARPDFGFALVDLRLHGKSQGFSRPHTLAHAANDLVELERSLRRPDVVIGHSLGGKVAICYGLSSVANDKASVRQIWALDSDPGPQVAGESHEVMRVLSALKKLPAQFATRTEAVELLLTAGLSNGLVNWLSTNFEREGSGFVLRLDLEAIEELLEDYFRVDFWPKLEALGGAASRQSFHLVVAENSDRWSGTMRQRARALPKTQQLVLHELADSGHWVHVDNPEGLAEILLAELPRS